MTVSISTCCAARCSGVVGGSGSGKSVLLRTHRRAQPAGRRARSRFSDAMSWRSSDRQRRELEQRWGVLFQDGALFSSLTVAQNIEVPIKEYYPTCRCA